MGRRVSKEEGSSSGRSTTREEGEQECVRREESE